jgi:ABC-2 type transport system permease protein
MTPAHFFSIWRAETLKLLSRLSARTALLVCVALGLAGPALLYSIGSSEMVINGRPVTETLTLTSPEGSIWTLHVRNFFLMRIFIIMVAALSFAGEFSTRTLREDLIRPVPRWSILTAKWGALMTWIGLTVLIPWTLSSLLGVPLFGLEGTWREVSIGYALTWITDSSFCMLVLLIATLMRSVAGTIVGVFLFMIFDTFFGWGLYLMASLGSFFELPAAVQLVVEAHPWLPSAAYGLWSSYSPDQPLLWESMVALGLYTVLCFGLANLVFSRTDVP